MNVINFEFFGFDVPTVFPHIRPAGIIILHGLQMQVLLENSTFLLHKIVRIAGIIRVAGIIRGRALYEEIQYMGSLGFPWYPKSHDKFVELFRFIRYLERNKVNLAPFLRFH